jgi:hypothetical protein
LFHCLTAIVYCCAPADPEAAGASGGRRAPRRIPSNESFSSLSLAIKAMTRFGPSSYGNLQVRLQKKLESIVIMMPEIVSPYACLARVYEHGYEHRMHSTSAALKPRVEARSFVCLGLFTGHQQEQQQRQAVPCTLNSY